MEEFFFTSAPAKSPLAAKLSQLKSVRGYAQKTKKAASVVPSSRSAVSSAGSENEEKTFAANSLLFLKSSSLKGPGNYFQPKKVRIAKKLVEDKFVPMIKAAAFRRIIRSMSRAMFPKVRWQSLALTVLQEASEAYLLGVLEDAAVCANHAKRKTIMPKDIRLALRIRGDKF